ncbi:MAG: hypothetical protein CVV22_11405 [Ignavibacteriae bacterium HGW-Ignavibacteriae-1]|jgi:hypothetical protein|nr:MAG: hypothetical protein CVV22_11405 [Ignavibacteriae bacterium HGW-Ignavibacteriae-1]
MKIAFKEEKDRAIFEYYVWHLSSESLEIRENSAAKIIDLGNEAIPKLLNKLDRKYIFETDYIVYCLEEITNESGKYQTSDSAIRYWKNWVKLNNYYD